MRKTIVIDWNDLSSIKKAEKTKLQLENLGYSLIRTQSTPEGAILTYELKE